MTDTGQGEGWWQASDGKWYPPEQHPDYQAPATQPLPAAAPPGPLGPPSGPPPGPPPGAPGSGSSAAPWIVVGVVAAVVIVIAALLLTRDSDKEDKVAATRNSSSSSLPSSSSSQSTGASSRSASSSSRPPSSSIPTAPEIETRLLKAADLSPDFEDSTSRPQDDPEPVPCGQDSVSRQFLPAVDVGATVYSSHQDITEQVSVYDDPSTAGDAFRAWKDGVNCTQGVYESQDVTISPSKDVSSELGVPEAVEIDFQSSDTDGRLYIVHAGESIVVFAIEFERGADSAGAPSPEAIVKKGLTKLSS